MKQVFIPLLLATLFVAPLSAQVAQTSTSNDVREIIILERLNGTNSTHPLDLVSKLSFPQDSIVLFNNNRAVINTEKQSNIRKIIFTEEVYPTAISDDYTNSLQIYPNPTSDYLIISGVEPSTTIRLYASDGKLIQTTAAQDSNVSLPVSQLPQGQYLLQVNTTIVKFLKK